MIADRTTLHWPSRAELRWAAGFAALVMALTCLPYLYGLLISPEDAHYSGLLTNPDEHNVYLAYMKQAQEGAVFLIDPFTSEPQQGRVINLFFLALGRSAALKHIALPIEYHLARLISGWLLLTAIYCLGAQAISSVSARRLALTLAAFASGFGWLYHAGPGQPHPIDYGPGLVMPEAITFLTLLLNPLFCFSAFLMIAVIGLGAHALSSGRTRSAVLAGLAILILGNVHSYDVIPAAVVLAAYLVFLGAARRFAFRTFALAALIALIGAPSLLYQLWLLHSGEVTLAIKTAETPVHSPPPLLLALGLGLPLFLALSGLWRAARPGASDGARLLAFWLVLGFALVYIPVPFQRKLAQGIHLPAVLLAIFGVEPLLQHLRRAGTVLAAILVLIALPSNALFLLRAKHDLETNNVAYLGNLMPPLYLTGDQYEALRWLDEHASFRDVLLCNSFLGSYAPSLAGTRVYVGHWAETLHYRAKLTSFAEFLRAGAPEASRQAFVRREGISYVLRDRSIYDQASLLSPDGAIMPAFDLERASWLEQAHESGTVSVYRVR
jgi:hypothetical protein